MTGASNWLLCHDVSTLLIDTERLKSLSAPDCSDRPPWVPISTAEAAKLLGVHVKTLLKWSRLGVGPKPEPRDRYTCNALYWKPASLAAWWERLAGLPERSEQQICDEWLSTRPPGFVLIMKGPPQAIMRHQKRRRRDQRRLERRAARSLMSS